MLNDNVCVGLWFTADAMPHMVQEDSYTFPPGELERDLWRGTNRLQLQATEKCEGDASELHLLKPLKKPWFGAVNLASLSQEQQPLKN
jgi:hypothetical protein